MRRKAICITLDQEDLRKVKKWAIKEDRSVSYTINLFIKEALSEPEKCEQIIRNAPKGRYAQR